MAIQNKDLQKLLKKNPFMTKESIYAFYEKKLKKYLDPEFEEYCTCDDYYEPVVEAFELTYDVEHWCKENGFEVISYEGDGSDGVIAQQILGGQHKRVAFLQNCLSVLELA